MHCFDFFFSCSGHDKHIIKRGKKFKTKKDITDTSVNVLIHVKYSRKLSLHKQCSITTKSDDILIPNSGRDIICY